MTEIISFALLAAAAIGCVLLIIQISALVVHVHKPALPRPELAPGISILKPLCGLEDDLELHLEQFAKLAYPHYELLLGVKDASDTAYPLARRIAARHPQRVRVITQRGEPGLNPKVNQLITLAQAARHEILVVSDSNIAVTSDYLDEIAALLCDASVGIVTHLIAGTGGERLGSRMDNLQLSGAIAPGIAGAHHVAKKSIVIGKSMALRRADLAALGGFAAVRDVLAEDYVIGRAIPKQLGKRVALARRPVRNVSRQQGLQGFMSRWRRWSVIHRKAVGPVTYAGELLLNPVLLATCAACAAPSVRMWEAASACLALRCATDALARRALGDSPTLGLLVTSPLRDLFIGAAWVHGLLHDTIVWRGNARRVLSGTRLAPAEETSASELPRAA
jgi:ceramide glucosyltransferase